MLKGETMSTKEHKFFDRHLDIDTNQLAEYLLVQSDKIKNATFSNTNASIFTNAYVNLDTNYNNALKSDTNNTLIYNKVE